MKTFSLSPRLQVLADLIGEKDVVADIGTDHGKLITWLALHKKINYGYACDVREGPLKKGESTIRYFGAEDKVNTVLTNGLEGLNNKNITAFIIAGMGGELIGEIILGEPWSHNANTTFYLQPMTRDYQLRETLYLNGFYISQEIPITCGKHSYTCMEVLYSGKKTAISLFQAWTGKMWENSSTDGKSYLLECYVKLCKMAPFYLKNEEYIGLILSLKERLGINEC